MGILLSCYLVATGGKKEIVVVLGRSWPSAAMLTHTLIAQNVHFLCQSVEAFFEAAHIVPERVGTRRE